MKKIVVCISMILFALGLTARANAIQFTDEVDYDGKAKKRWKGITATKFIDKAGKNWKDNKKAVKKGAPFKVSHSASFGSEPVEIQNATLTVTFKENKANKREAWLITDGGGALVGNLKKSKKKWVEQEFVLSSSLYEDVINGTFELALDEGTRGKDKIWIAKTVLKGDYELIPTDTDSDTDDDADTDSDSDTDADGDSDTDADTDTDDDTDTDGDSDIDLDMDSDSDIDLDMDMDTDLDTDSDDPGDGGAKPVSEPSTMLLIGAGLIGLAGFRRYLKK